MSTTPGCSQRVALTCDGYWSGQPTTDGTTGLTGTFAESVEARVEGAAPVPISEPGPDALGPPQCPDLDCGKG